MHVVESLNTFGSRIGRSICSQKRQIVTQYIKKKFHNFYSVIDTGLNTYNTNVIVISICIIPCLFGLLRVERQSYNEN